VHIACAESINGNDRNGGREQILINRRFYPFNALRSLLGIGGEAESPTYRELFDGDWKHPTASGHGR
jgi:hypothetical protein